MHRSKKKNRKMLSAIHNNLISYACLSIDIEACFGKWKIIIVTSITTYMILTMILLTYFKNSIQIISKLFIANSTPSIKVLKASRGSDLFCPKQKKKNIYDILSCGRIDFCVSAYWWNMILNCALQHHILWLPRKKNIHNKCAVADDDLKCHMTFESRSKKKKKLMSSTRRKSEKNKREPTNNDWSLRLKTHWLNRVLKQMFSI